MIVYRTLTECVGDRFAANAVLLCAPLNGSRAARGAARFQSLRPLLGPHLMSELVAPTPRRWDGPGADGVIAGTLRVGTGQFFAQFDEDNDGTVGVSETRIPGLADHLVLPHSHFGMLMARDVAAQDSRISCATGGSSPKAAFTPADAWDGRRALLASGARVARRAAVPEPMQRMPA